MEDVTVTLYRFSKCGFYDGEDLKFGNPMLTFKGLHDWLDTVATIGESSTYTPSEDDAFLRCFCLDIRNLTRRDCRLLVTWNELAHVEEGVQVVEVGSQIGHANVSAVEVDALTLPGYPAFYFVDSRAKNIINFRFEQRLNGSRQFQRFILGFLASSSEWCVWNVDDDSELLGYTDDEDGEIPGDVEPLFSTTLVRVADQEDFIRQNRERIRKVIKRASVNPEVEEHKTFLDASFGILGLPVNNRLKAEISFQYEFKTKLTEEKLESIIAESETRLDYAWDDVGFEFSRESGKIHWLSGSIARKKWQVDIDRSDSGMINVDQLVDYINENIEQILEALKANA